MESCKYIQKCPFFNQLEENAMHQLVERMKQQFCLSGGQGCARLKVRTTIGPEQVPLLMMPHQLEWADQVVHDHKVGFSCPKS